MDIEDTLSKVNGSHDYEKEEISEDNGKLGNLKKNLINKENTFSPSTGSK